jgi:hypothetical protein
MSVSEIQEALGKYSKNYEWFNSNYESLRKDYPNKVIAVDNEKVIASDVDLDILKEKTKHIPGVFITAVLSEKLIWIL